MRKQRVRFISYTSIAMEVNAVKLFRTFLKDANKIDDLERKIKELKKQNKQLKQMINTTIGVSYDKDETEAIDYLVNEVNHYPDLFINDKVNGKTKRKRNNNDKTGEENIQIEKRLIR